MSGRRGDDGGGRGRGGPPPNFLEALKRQASFRGGDGGRRGRGGPPFSQASLRPSPSEASRLAVEKRVREPLLIPARPGLGNLGVKCQLRANHFVVEMGKQEFHHYAVTISPLVRDVNREIISQLVTRYRESDLGKKLPAYDGSKSLFTAGPLPFEYKQFSVKLPGKAGRKDRKFDVAIKFVVRVDQDRLRQFLSGNPIDAPQDTIQALDIILRAAALAKYTVVGRSFFSPTFGDPGELGNGAVYWRGYYQSLRPTQMGLSLNINVSARSFYEPMPVIDFIIKHVRLRGDINCPLSDQDREKIENALRGLKVVLNVSDYTRTYKITGVSKKPLSKIIFTRDGKEVSVVQHFEQIYNAPLKNKTFPALESSTGLRHISLPVELCSIEEGQSYKQLTAQQVIKLLKANCQRPCDREEKIKSTVEVNNLNNYELVREEFGIQVKEGLTVVDARVFPAPTLNYHDSEIFSKVNPTIGKWNMKDMKMVNGGLVDYWTCVNFSTKVNQDSHKEFCKLLIQMCVNKGMNPLIPIRSAQPTEIENVLLDIHNQCEAKLSAQDKARLQLLIIILPDDTGSYGTIKRVCETQLGIVSQCCRPEKLHKFDMPSYESLALKINVKVGGRNHVLSDAIQKRLPMVSDRPTIILGADVTHPSAGDDSSPSIAAVVASMDWPEITKYRGVVSAQGHRKESIQDLYKSPDKDRGIGHSGMIRELFIAFLRSTKQKPSRVIFYRDGVSETQFNHVLLDEVDAIHKACASLEEEYLPPVTFVVVQKRHNTRFFPERTGDSKGNVLPGTVVDTDICHPREFDFYLNSHASIMGTSRPTHYHVLYDENGFSADDLQKLTYSLCYTYARCTRSVSIVPPAYYAHLAAFRARYYIEGETSDGNSSGGRTSGTGRNQEIQPLPAIKDNVKEVMFYC